MFTIALKAVDDLLGTLTKVPVPAGAAGELRQQAVQDGSKAVPSARAVGEDIVKFAAETLGVLGGLVAGGPGGLETAKVVQAVHGIGEALARERAKLAPVAVQLGRFRDGLCQDVGKLTQEQVQLQARLSGLAAQRNHWAAQSESVHKQKSITDIIGTFIPFVPQAAGEIASEIQYGKSTEQALAEADRQLTAVGVQAHSLQGMITTGTQLRTAVTELTGATQNLDNAASLLGGNLTDAAVDAAAANARTLTLFLKTLTSSIEMLRAGAS